MMTGDIIIYKIIELSGVFMWTISGIRHASAKDFDMFGAYVCGFSVALGGGTIRDILLGVPVFWLSSTYYVYVTFIAFFFLLPSDLPFKPDTSLIPVYDGKKWGYIDKKGQYVINPQFSDADWFSDGLARVENKDGKYGFIDKKGTYKIPAKYVDEIGRAHV